jgi:hypothetical protein
MMENQLDKAFRGRFAGNASSKIWIFAVSCHAFDIFVGRVVIFACL